MTKQILLRTGGLLLWRSLAFNLERDGYRPSTAANAEDLLALGRRDLPDLLLVPEEGRIAEWGKVLRPAGKARRPPQTLHEPTRPAGGGDGRR